MYRPEEIIVVRKVMNHSVTRSILDKCSNVPVRIIESNRPEDIKAASHLIRNAKGMSETIAVGKRVLALLATTNVISLFHTTDRRIGCPHFTKLAMVTNGCYYRCVWCYLQSTYRALYPCIAVRVDYEAIKKRIRRYLRKTSTVVIFNVGELQDSLALERLTGAAQLLIPFFADLPNGRQYMLTKCDDVESILNLRHNRHTIVAWSLNAPEVSQEFEVGAPSFDCRLNAAKRAQEAGYPVRIRLDPLVPVGDWKRKYANGIRRIFDTLTPERVTIGTLRFEQSFYNNRYAILQQRPCGQQLLSEMERMEPMLAPISAPTGKRDKDGRVRTKISIGKYSYPRKLRIELFSFVLGEIRRHYEGPVAICKEMPEVWKDAGLDPRHCQCVCQYEAADLCTGVTGETMGGTA